GDGAALAGVVLAAPDGGQAELVGQHRLLEALGVEARVGLDPVAGAQLGPGAKGRWAWHARDPTPREPGPDQLRSGRSAALELAEDLLLGLGVRVRELGCQPQHEGGARAGG